MEQFTDFLSFVVEIVFWYFVISIIINFFIIRAKDKKEEFDSALGEALKRVHIISEERHGGHLYWFDHESDEFLGQGISVEECIEHVKKRFPSHVFFLPDQKYISAPNWTPTVYTKSNTLG
jgi:type II secretory pathway component PulF